MWDLEKEFFRLEKCLSETSSPRISNVKLKMMSGLLVSGVYSRN